MHLTRGDDVAGGRAVATITLDSPANRNALSAPLRAQLLDALRTVAADAEVRVVVLAHRGPVFCSGMDLAEAAAAAPGAQGVRELPALLRAITACPQPVIARVGGPARAGGIGLLAAADIVVAAPTATFAFTEVRIGLIPAVISVPVLRRIGASVANELMLTGEVFDARRAQAIGLVTALSDDAEGLDALVDSYAERLLRGGPRALAGTKALLAHEHDDSAERYEAMLAVSAEQFASTEAREGARAFVEKRPPRWAGS